jgi:uncharacterized UPF0160 family protein
MKNTSSSNFDKDLNQIEHYIKFPSMIPYVGENYGNLKNKRILLIAESHYFPQNSTIHYEAKNWYDSSANDLTDEEIYHINTKKVLETDWVTVSDVIFREINSTIQPFILNNESRAMNYAAFMNCFQRPGKTGDSISHTCNSIDTEKAYETITSVIDVLKPDIVIFYSKFAWDNVGWKLAQNIKNINFEFSCHPATGGRYWHKKDYKNNKNKIITYLNDKLK